VSPSSTLHCLPLVRDRDTKFTASFDDVFESDGAQILRTPFRSPNANAYAQRFVRTVRSECLDHLLVVSAPHLERILRSYATHYNGHRPHQGLSQEIPASPSSAAQVPRPPGTIPNSISSVDETASAGSFTSTNSQHDASVFSDPTGQRGGPKLGVPLSNGSPVLRSHS
jgi:hypothetical protein